MFGRSRAAALAILVALSLCLVAVGSVPAADAAKTSHKPHKPHKPRKPPKPVVSKVDPNTGPTIGGSVVTIKGKHLKTATKVLFGKAKGTALKVKSDRKLTVVAPAHAEGGVDIVVKTKGGKSAKARGDRFTYQTIRPQVAAVSPSSGPTAGGTVVTVTGSGFVGVTAVNFDGAPGVSVSVSSPSRLTVTTPEHVAALTHIDVTTATGTSPHKNTDLFRFIAVPRSSVAPVPPGADVDPRTRLSALSCPGAGACMAVGYYFKDAVPTDTRSPLIEQRTGTTTWTAIDPALPLDAAPDPDAQLVDLSCPSTTFCAAIGAYMATDGKYHPMATTWNGSAWGAASPVGLPAGSVGISADQLGALDCASVTSCIAVGGDYDGAVHTFLVVSYDGSSWTATHGPSPAAVEPTLRDVSCVSATDCFAVGSGDGAGGQVPVVATLTSSGWTATAPPLPILPMLPFAPPDGLLTSVSCTSAISCTAVGSYETADSHYLGLIVQMTAVGITSSAIGGPAGASADPNVDLQAVSCTVDVQCTSVGTYAAPGGTRAVIVAMGSAGFVPSDATLPAGGIPSAVLDDVTCIGENNCAAVGSTELSPGPNQVPLLESKSNLGWAVAAAPVPAGVTDAGLTSVTRDGSSAVGVGRFHDSSGHLQAMITVDIPLA